MCAICVLLKLIGQFCEGFIRPSCKPGFSTNNSDCKIRELFPYAALLQSILAKVGARVLQEFLANSRIFRESSLKITVE